MKMTEEQLAAIERIHCGDDGMFMPFAQRDLRALLAEARAYSLMQQLKLIPSYMGGRYRVSSSPESILGQGLFSSRWHDSLSDAIEECAAKMEDTASA
jgi:hypothetical protein